ncbi:MAG: ROK family protein [Defluviitaleaceae bacterium]|nr:ROK family protein [Defluviitaleaceae bacterium]
MYNIGIDLGGTNIAGGIVDSDGKLVHKKSIPTLHARGADTVITDIITLCKDLAQESSINFDQIKSIGIGCPGIVNPPDGILIYATNLNFKDVSIGEKVSKVLNLPVYIENDANCAALGESMFGAAKGSKHSVAVTLGTGVGGGIIIDGSIYSGPFFGAGELGHHIIRIGGELCGCGGMGCWEAYASATALIRETVKEAKNNPNSIINRCVSGNLDKITAKTAFDAAAEGDATAKEVVNNYLDHLCVGLSNIINLLQPEIIVIGGGISGQGNTLITAIEDRVSETVLGGSLKTRFVIAQLGNDAGIVGAAMLGKDS